MGKRKVVWDELAKQRLKQYCQYIYKTSPQAAKRVRKTITDTVKSLPEHPEMFASDRFSDEKKGNYRAFTKWNYRVMYEVTDTQIIIVNMVHTRQYPENFEE